MSLDTASSATHASFARASIAVDLGAESCRVSLLRWIDGAPHIELVHRFANGPVRAADGTLRWPLNEIVAGVEHGMRLCTQRATEGIQSVGVDGWAVDYVRLDESGQPLEAPFCYRDERNEAAQLKLHERISADRLREITGLQLQSLNTLYQLYADRLAGKPSGTMWLNLPEYLLARWSGERVSEYTNATHTQMVDITTRGWSNEILQAAEIEIATMPRLVPPGTILGTMSGPLASLPAFRGTQIVAPACHDTASAVAGIPATGGDWGYISSGTWSLVGTTVTVPQNNLRARELGLTNLGLDSERSLLQKNVNGMWLIKQCIDVWATLGVHWEVAALCEAARSAVVPTVLLDVDAPELLRMDDMPMRISEQLEASGGGRIDTSPSGAPAMASLIFRSLAACYAALFQQMEELTGKSIDQIFLVGGGSRNTFLRELTAEATGKQVLCGSAESSTVGNFALQLAAMANAGGAESKREIAAHYAALLCECPFETL